MRAPFFGFVSLLLTLSAAADAQTTTRPPPAVLTVGSDLKELIFDWEPVPGAAIYRLMANTAPRNYFELVGERIPASRTRAAIAIAAHDLDWWNRRYVLESCNPAGCTRSNIVAPTEHMLSSIGYFKSSNPGVNDRHGGQVALSADGTTMAVVADGEDGTNDSLFNSGAVTIYRRNGRQWAQETVLKASDGLANTRLGGGAPMAYRYLGISANGSTVAVGAPTRSRLGLANAGVVFVFKRAADDRWSEVAQFTSSPIVADDFFGYSVDVSSDGDVVKVSSMYPQGGTGTPEGRTHIWNWNTQSWAYTGPIAPFYPGDRCPTTRMTADAKLLISACRTPEGQGRLVTTMRVAEQTWSRVADQAYPWFENPNMAVTYDGSWLAVHQGNVYYPEGGIGLYRRANLDWVPDAHHLDGTGSGVVGYNGFGHAIEFSRHGDFLAFSNPVWRLGGAGVIDRNGAGASPEQHGGVMLLKLVPESRPQFQYTRFIKATNPGNADRFGASVAFGGADGFYFAVGAPGEDSAASGVDGNQDNEAVSSAGAVYLY
jgi:hypothetical protein